MVSLYHLQELTQKHSQRSHSSLGRLYASKYSPWSETGLATTHKNTEKQPTSHPCHYSTANWHRLSIVARCATSMGPSSTFRRPARRRLKKSGISQRSAPYCQLSLLDTHEEMGNHGAAALLEYIQQLFRRTNCRRMPTIAWIRKISYWSKWNHSLRR